MARVDVTAVNIVRRRRRKPFFDFLYNVAYNTFATSILKKIEYKIRDLPNNILVPKKL